MKPLPSDSTFIFPVEDVRAAREDRGLQRRHAEIVQAIAAENPDGRSSHCGGEVAWFYFESPVETWEHLCGRAGPIAWCAEHGQVGLFCEVMN
jgi:hypothetical protein